MPSVALVVVLLALAATGDAAEPACAAGADSCPTTRVAPDLFFQDGFLSNDTLREELAKYLEAQKPTNPLGVVMVPAPQELAERFQDTLRGLGASSGNAGRFPQLALSAYAGGDGRLPGKTVSAGHKGCHADFEVDSGFNIDNVVGPTDGRVGILYLQGEGEFVLVDEATGEEARQEIKPGRFMSWPNRGNKHCVVTNSPEPRRFLGPLVLDKGASSFIPVVDILAGPAQACTTNGDCTTPGETCDGKLCCTAAGGAATYDTFCCPGSIFWNPQRKCCYMTGMSASSAEQCCYGRLIDSVCAPPGSLRCVSQCKAAAGDAYEKANARCAQLGGSRALSCTSVAAAMRSMHVAYCYAGGLPTKC